MVIIRDVVKEHGQEPIKLIYHPAEFGGQRYSGNGGDRYSRDRNVM